MATKKRNQNIGVIPAKVARAKTPIKKAAPKDDDAEKEESKSDAAVNDTKKGPGAAETKTTGAAETKTTGAGETKTTGAGETKTTGAGIKGIIISDAISSAINANKLNLLVSVEYNSFGEISVNVFGGKKPKTAGNYYKTPKK
jgi:hypothetical protein